MSALADPAVGSGPEPVTLSSELLRVLTSGDAVRLRELLSSEGRPRTDGHVALNVNAPPRSRSRSPPRVGTNCLLGVASSGNTALHLVASRGHAELAALVCERAPCLVATRNKGLDTPLHCAAKAGSRDVAACLVSRMLDGRADGAAALQARNCLGATVLHEAVRLRHASVVDILMAVAPKLASLTTEHGVSALYMAAVSKSEQIVRLLLRPSTDGAPSPASFAGRSGRTALHAAAIVSKGMAQEILNWEPVGPTLLTSVDSSGRTPLQFAILYKKLDVVELFLDGHTSEELAYISDNEGLFPVHTAAIVGSTWIIDELVRKCPNNYHELVDDDGMNLLHVAVVSGQNNVVNHICQNGRFSTLWNASDFEGNTPLHLAVKYGHTRIVSTLLYSTSVEININNKDGLNARDLAYIAAASSPSRYFLDPSQVVYYYLCCAGAKFSIDRNDVNINNMKSSEDKKRLNGWLKGNGTTPSALITTVTFAAAVTVPGGLKPDDHSYPGTATLARRFAFRAFAVSNTVAFLCSMVATCWFIYGDADEVQPIHRDFYNGPASGLLPVAVQFMIAAFAFGFHLVLGAANHGLMILVYFVSSVSVLFCFTDIWVPFFLGYLKCYGDEADGWAFQTKLGGYCLLS